MWLMCGGKEALASYGRGADLDRIPAEHWHFINSCRDYWKTETHFFVHANYDPMLALEEQTTEILRWQYLDQRTARQHWSGKTAIVGHTSQRNGQVLDLGFLKCIDTGCESGGWFTGLNVATGQLSQVDALGRLR
jgi:serine/threonine protein phosphatase 1